MSIYHLFSNGKAALYSTQLGRRVNGWFDADGKLYAWEQIDKAGRLQARVSAEKRKRMCAIEPTYRKHALLAEPNEYGTRSVRL